MKEFTHVLDGSVKKDAKTGEEKAPVFKGSIKIKILPYLGRVELLKSLMLKNDESGNVSIDSNVSSIEKMYQIAKEHTVELNLVRISDECELKSFEDLEYDVDGGAMIQEIASLVIGGVKLGKR